MHVGGRKNDVTKCHQRDEIRASVLYKCMKLVDVASQCRSELYNEFTKGRKNDRSFDWTKLIVRCHRRPGWGKGRVDWRMMMSDVMRQKHVRVHCFCSRDVIGRFELRIQ